MNLSNIEKDLISEVKLSPTEAKLFLFVTTSGKKTIKEISNYLELSESKSLDVAKKLTHLGAFIELSNSVFEAMHPRFTAVNMYRRMCEKNNIEFKRNKVVDSIGIRLEKPYDDARTKYDNQGANL